MIKRGAYLLFLLPPLFLLVLSLSSQWYFPQLWPSFTFVNWQMLLLSKSELLRSMLLGLSLSSLVSLTATCIAFPVSRYLFLSRRAELFKKLSLLPFVISPVIYAVSLQYYFVRLGLAASFIGVALAQLFVVFPYALLLFSGFWNHKHMAMQQLVASLGGGWYQQWRHGLWPFARQVLGVCLFQSFLVSWFDFGFTQQLGVGKVKTLTIQVYSLVSEANPYVAAVASVLLILPPMFMLMLNKFILFKKL